MEDGFLFQGLTSVSDPLGRHNYSLNLSLDTLTKKTGGGFDYTYAMKSSSIGTTYLIRTNPFREPPRPSSTNTEVSMAAFTFQGLVTSGRLDSQGSLSKRTWL